MLGFIKSLFGSKPAEPVVEVPYKVEAVVDTADVAIAQLPVPVAEVAPAPVVEAKSTPAKKAPAKKAPASKKPRRPRAPKVAK